MMRFRPLRNYFYWEPHCYDIPVCSAVRSVYDSLDGVDRLTEKLQELRPDLDNVDAVMPQLAAQLPPLIDTMKNLRTMLLTMHSTMSGIVEQVTELSASATAMGQDFDTAKNDDSFYMPREVFANADFQRVMKLFLSPDGKAARFIISHRGDPSSAEGIGRVDAIKTAAEEALKGTPLEDAKIYLSGTASIFKDLTRSRGLRSVDRRDCVTLCDFHDHVDHHAKSGRRYRDRGYRRAFVGRVIWAISAALAVRSRLQPALARAGDVLDHSLGCGIGL